MFFLWYLEYLSFVWLSNLFFFFLWMYCNIMICLFCLIIISLLVLLLCCFVFWFYCFNQFHIFVIVKIHIMVVFLLVVLLLYTINLLLNWLKIHKNFYILIFNCTNLLKIDVIHSKTRDCWDADVNVSLSCYFRLALCWQFCLSKLQTVIRKPAFCIEVSQLENIQNVKRVVSIFNKLVQLNIKI